MIDIDVDLRSLLRDVRDQGARPTCLAHAVSTAHEHALGLAVFLSPEYLYFFASRKHATPGNSMNDAVEALEDEGQPEEADCSYLAADPPLGWAPPKGLRVFRRASRVTTADADEVARAIRVGQIPILGIDLPYSFFAPHAPWVITSSGSLRGLHAVAGVGIGSHKGRSVVLVRNSWGPDWGDRGYAWLDDVFIAQHLKEVMLLSHEVIP